MIEYHLLRRRKNGEVEFAYIWRTGWEILVTSERLFSKLKSGEAQIL